MCEYIRPARPGVGVSAKKFALHGQNERKTPFSGALGELFRGTSAGWAAWGELFRGNAVGGPALGEYFRGRAAARSHRERVYVRTQSLRRPLISRGTNFACNSLQGISSFELEPLKFCRFRPVVHMGSARIACEIVEVIPVSAVKRQDSWWGEEPG